ncbi:CHAT domain-containing protein [Streptosporangium carneum]|uniref:CHAT domain-containing protein n=1 Tax=Streptosporangium carneum TaxID=47481 RepID=UPI0022F33F00|nr:CHAT domain-containing protein [Streptosporangium carneum]
MDTQRRFWDLVEDKEFLAWWNQAAAGGHDKLFLLRFPPKVWELPWELLVENLKATRIHPHVLIARGVDTSIPESPRVFDKPLKILILKGAIHARGYSRLNLDGETKLIMSAWSGLPQEARRCVLEPVITDKIKGKAMTITELPDLLREHLPDVLWFSGHGRRDPKPGLLFADGTWVPPQRFAESITASGHVPLYTVFWACDTGRSDPSDAGNVSSPAFFAALTQAGVMSSLLVQAPIGDISATKLAHKLFFSLATGLSLEAATARARADLLDDAAARKLDWSLPVVWSSGLPELRLEWDSVERARLQFLGAEILARALLSPSQLLGAPTSQERDRASAWVRRLGNWIVGEFSSENKYVWLRTLQAIQADTSLLVICVDLSVDVGRPQTVEDRLASWAEQVYLRIRPGKIPRQMTSILTMMQEHPQKGWRDLCSMTDIFLAVVQPPTYEATWFWQNLQRAAVAAVLSPNQVPHDIINGWGWAADRISAMLDDQIIEAAVRQAPRLAQALAVLGTPIPPTYLRLTGITDGQPSTVRDWELADTVLVKTLSGGRVMAAAAQDYIMRALPDREIRQAHQDCIAILSELRPSLEVSDNLLGHLINARMDDEALMQAAYLCQQYWRDNQPQAVRRTIRRLGSLQTDLPSEARLIAAWAHVVLGDMVRARYWLDRAHPVALLDSAWKCALLAELLKSEGTEVSRQGTLDNINQAVEFCTEALRSGDDQTRFGAQRQQRAYRQNRARIMQYLFYDASGAAAEYHSLINESRNDLGADLDVAIMRRNYAECLTVLATGPEDHRWDDARTKLQEALEAASAYPQLPVISEILYEQAGMAEAESARAVAERLLGECIEAASEAGHEMMVAIAENKRFWLTGPFSMDTWQEIADRLEGYANHGWAARSLMNSRIRAAQVLAVEHDFNRAWSLLQENRSLLAHSRAFYIGRSDEWRIVLTYSGLEVLAAENSSAGQYWQEFLQRYPWSSEWLEERAIHDPAQAWGQL